MRMHTGEAPYVCRHDGCEMRFKWKSSLVHHKRSHTAGYTGENGNSGSSSNHFSDLVARGQECFTRDTLDTQGSLETSTIRSDSLSDQVSFTTPLDTPIVTVAFLENLLDEPVEDVSYHSLLSFDLSQDDISVVSSMNQKLSSSKQPHPEGDNSKALERMVLDEQQWR